MLNKTNYNENLIIYIKIWSIYIFKNFMLILNITKIELKLNKNK